MHDVDSSVSSMAMDEDAIMVMEEPTIDADQVSQSREYLVVLNRRRVTIALSVLVVVATAIGLSLVQKPAYSASAEVIVPVQPASSALNPTAQQLPEAYASQRSLVDEQQFAQGDDVRKAATAELGYRATVTVTSSATSDLLTFNARSAKKAAAAMIANAYAHGFIRARTTEKANQYTNQVTALQTSIGQLQAKAAVLPSKDPQLPALQQSVMSLTISIQQLQASGQLVAQTGPTVVSDAKVPISPVSPKPVRNVILALVVGLVLGLALALLVDRIDDSIKSREDVERSTGQLPILGMIPVIEGWRKREETHVILVESPTSVAAEAYRTLRTSVQFQAIDRQLKVIGITSAVAEEGKTTTIANLAVSLSHSGQRVIVVSCDLRRPRIHHFFGQEHGIGLTSVLLGDVSALEAIQPVEGQPRLRLLSSGPIPPNPAEILSLDRSRALVDWLASQADTILLDCPPVLPVADSLLLSRLVDGMMIVASAQTTKRRDLRRAVGMLRQVGAPITGIVLNCVPQARGYEYGYYYSGYGSERTTDASSLTEEANGVRRAQRSQDQPGGPTRTRPATPSPEHDQLYP